MSKDNKEIGEKAMQVIADYPLYVAGLSNITYEQAIAIADIVDCDWRDRKNIFTVIFTNGDSNIFEAFEADNKDEAREQAELWLQDEASDFAGKRGYKIEGVYE